MKKIFFIMGLVFISTGIFATEISIGGYVGGEINKGAINRVSFPQIGILSNFEFQHFGLRTLFGFDFRIEKIKSLHEGTEFKNCNFREFFFITPYYPFRHKTFTFGLGPALGFKFDQRHWERPLEKEDNFYLVCGAEFETRYAATDHAKVFFILGLFTDTGEKQTKNEKNNVPQPLKNFQLKKASLYTIAKLGVMYTF